MKLLKEHKFLTLKISLLNTTPQVWREIVVLDSLTFHALHEVIQVAMGWTNSHLYGFTIGRDIRISSIDFSDSFGMSDDIDASKTKLSEFLARARQKFVYEYDFGDSWNHEIKVLKITAMKEKPPFKATILGGANACPPEDCGGVGGYENLKLALADPTHPEHEEMKEWIGDDFQPNVFDIKAVQEILEGQGAQKYRKAVGC